MIGGAPSHVPVLIVLMRGSRGPGVRRRQVALNVQKEPSCKKICDDLYRRFGVGRVCVCGQ